MGAPRRSAMGCCASKAFQTEPDSAKFDDVGAQSPQRVGQQLEQATPTCNTRPPQHVPEYSQCADLNADPFHGNRQSGDYAPPPQGRRLSLDQRLQQQIASPNEVNFVPSQGQRLSLDHILLDQRADSVQPLAGRPAGSECVASNRYPYAYPSQGGRLSLDQRMESSANDCIQRPPPGHSGPDARGDPPSNRPRSSVLTTARQKGRRSKQQVKHAYLNLDSECATVLSGQASLTNLLSPGPQFSLRGRLVHTRASRASGENGEERHKRGTRVQQFVLAPEDGLQYSTWRKQRGQLEPLQPPTKINRYFFQGPMGATVSAETMGSVLLSLTNDSTEKAVDISSVPKFPCINTPSLVKAEGAITLWRQRAQSRKGEGSGFEYLRTSRDC